jgi:hypothetical protein
MCTARQYIEIHGVCTVQYLTYILYFEKQEGVLRNHLAVCVPPPTPESHNSEATKTAITVPYKHIHDVT